jgi:hypothetical protein
LCHYLWDLFLSGGGLILVKFAVVLVMGLEKQLMEMEEACDVTEFLGTLREITTFNRYLNVRELLMGTCLLQIQREDFRDLGTPTKVAADFYGKYIRVAFEE